MPYPVDSAIYRLDYSHPNLVGWKVSVYPPKGSSQQPMTFYMDVTLSGAERRRRWRVSNWSPASMLSSASGAPVGAEGSNPYAIAAQAERDLTRAARPALVAARVRAARVRRARRRREGRPRLAPHRSRRTLLQVDLEAVVGHLDAVRLRELRRAVREQEASRAERPGRRRSPRRRRGGRAASRRGRRARASPRRRRGRRRAPAPRAPRTAPRRRSSRGRAVVIRPGRHTSRAGSGGRGAASPGSPPPRRASAPRTR